MTTIREAVGNCRWFEFRPSLTILLFGPLAGCHGARRGTYRVVYRIDEQAHVVEVLDIDHRADIYHRSLRLVGRRGSAIPGPVGAVYPDTAVDLPWNCRHPSQGCV